MEHPYQAGDRDVVLSLEQLEALGMDRSTAIKFPDVVASVIGRPDKVQTLPVKLPAHIGSQIWALNLKEQEDACDVIARQLYGAQYGDLSSSLQDAVDSVLEKDKTIARLTIENTALSQIHGYWLTAWDELSKLAHACNAIASQSPSIAQVRILTSDMVTADEANQALKEYSKSTVDRVIQLLQLLARVKSSTMAALVWRFFGVAQ